MISEVETKEQKLTQMRFGFKQKVLHAKSVLKLFLFFPTEIFNCKSDK